MILRFMRVPAATEDWYVDIGAHVKQGNLLAQIETPELDQPTGTGPS